MMTKSDIMHNSYQVADPSRTTEPLNHQSAFRPMTINCPVNFQVVIVNEYSNFIYVDSSLP